MSLPAALWDMPSFAEIPREMAFGIASLTLVVVILFWRLNCEVGSDAERAYWDHKRHCIVASITELLKIGGRIPARRLFAAIYDEFEDVLVTEAPISVPSSSARLGEMTDRLRKNLGEELREAMDGLDVPEVQELKSLMERVQKVLKSSTAAKEPICSQELLKATEWLRGAAPVMRKRALSLMSFCNHETTFWLALGLVIKVVSQIPGPVRMLYITATVSAASRGQEGMHDFHAAAVASFWLFAAEKLLQFAGRITMFRGEQLFTLRLKREIFAACLRQDMEFFDTHRSGELMQRLNGDTAEICNKVLYFPVRFVQFSAFLVFNFATLLSANPRLVLATMSVLPFSLLGNIFLTKRLKRFSERMQKRAEMSASQTQEVFSNIRTVRSFAREGRELQRYMRDQEFEARIWRQMTFLQGMTQPLMHLISQISFFVGLYYGGILITQGLLSAGEVITLVQGVQACTGVVTDLFDTLPEIAKADLPAARIALLLESQSKIERPPDRPQGEELQDLIEGGTGGVAFTDVRFSYASRRECQVLRGLTFTAQGGEVVGLVGVTGCGKSTVVYLLLRFYAPTSGSIHFNGRPLQDYDVYGLRRKIGVVSQEPLLFGTSIRENLIYGLGLEAEENGHSVGDDFLREVCELANAWEFISQLPEGLATEVGERGVQLSGGQKQRIAIARAVAKRPKVLLLDEATSALDVESEKVVQSALDEVIRATACTTIVIAHRLATLQNATKIVVIESGAVVEQGEPEELESRPHGIYARMLQAQRRSNRVLPAKANGVHRANGRAASPAGAEDSPAAEAEASPAAGEGDAPSTEAPAEDVPDNGLRRRAAAPKTAP